MTLDAAKDWSPFRRQRAAERLRSLANRQRIINTYAHPAELMAACNEDYVITPAVELVSRKIEQVLRSRRKRLMISAPPQEFKSMLCAVTTPIRGLQLHPNWRIMLLTYADGLAEEHSRAARALVQQFGSGVVDSLTGQPLPDRLGISLHPQLASASNWRIAEGEGGLVAAGRDATITGKRADLLIVDDPFKNMQEADSHAMRTKIIEWYHSVATTRLAPGASVIIIQCMTGDTPVLRPDGSETPLRDIRPGDEIATYEHGRINTSTVRNWANQGPDDVLCIRVMSGRTVRANARHPFLTVKDGVETWKRASEITSGDRLVALSEAPGAQALTTWSVTADEVVEVVPCGREEVYDIEVERTENFIANGLVSHNTRWHPEDLCGQLLAHDKSLPPELREWHYINIPAISHPALPDALGREPGVALESARGRTKADFEAIERSVGKRVWNALYQGSPTPPEGGLFSQAWFDAHRLTEMPDRTRVRIVAVDPSESGEGDEAGVLGAALLFPPSQTAQALAKVMGDPDAPEEIVPEVVLTHDRSAQMTSQQWAAAAVDLALETSATHIFIETYTAGTTYINVVKSEIMKRKHSLAALRDSTPEQRAQLQALHMLLNRVTGWRGTGDSVARSGLLRQAVETGRCVVLGEEMRQMEEQAVNWTVGRHQPDRVAAAVIAHDRLVAMLGRQAQIVRPIGSPTGRNAWLGRKVG